MHVRTRVPKQNHVSNIAKLCIGIRVVLRRGLTDLSKARCLDGETRVPTDKVCTQDTHMHKSSISSSSFEFSSGSLRQAFCIDALP
jgi:hypothetical protein